MRFIRGLLCIVAVILSGCGDNKKDANATKIIMTSPDNPPFEYINTSSGAENVTGFDIDVIKAIADHLGWQFEVVSADFPSLIPALQSGRADMVIAAMNPTPEREKSVDFSIPYYNNTAALLVRRGSPVGSIDDLSGHQLGVQMGSVHEQTAKQLQTTNPAISLVSLSRVGDLVQELKTGRIEAVLLEGSAAEKIVQNNSDLLNLAVNNIESKPLSIVFPKGSPNLALVNQAIETLQKDGTIQGITKLWFTDVN